MVVVVRVVAVVAEVGVGVRGVGGEGCWAQRCHWVALRMELSFERPRDSQSRPLPRPRCLSFLGQLQDREKVSVRVTWMFR